MHATKASEELASWSPLPARAFSAMVDALRGGRDGNVDWREVPASDVHNAWMERASSAVHQVIDPSERARALSRWCFAKDQLELVQKYSRICNRLEKYGNQLCTKQEPLVSVTFPIKPLPNTRVSMAEGISRSFGAFCRQLHELTLEVAADRLESISPASMYDLVEFVRKTSGCLWEEMQRIVDRETTELEARVRVVADCARFAEQCIAAERKRLGSVRNQCDALLVALRDLRDNRMPKELKRRAKRPVAVAGPAKVARTWLRGLARRGWGMIFQTFLARPAVAKEVGNWCTVPENRAAIARIEEAFLRVHRDTEEDRAIVDNDEWAAAVFEALERHAYPLLLVCCVERGAIDWQLAQPTNHQCWCTVDLVLDAPEVAARVEAPLLQAPGHLGSFARGRLRLVAAPSKPANGKAPVPGWPDDGDFGFPDPNNTLCGTPYANALPEARGFALRLNKQRRTELAGVRMARALAALLEDGHLFLDRLGCDYANRIVICEYCKYERAVMRIEAETLQPFGELVGVPYKSNIPDLDTARRAQAQVRDGPQSSGGRISGVPLTL